jgi:EmrB/QacA subfamily drug resistance transporter
MTETISTDAVAKLSPRAKLEILGAILIALFLFALDQTVVGTALPVIVTQLNGNALYAWSITIYLLTSTISGPIYAKLSDLFGRRPIILWAVALFVVGSVLSGLSQDMTQFIIFRGLQGLGGGAVFPVALAVVADLYTPADRGKYLGFFGAVFGLSSLVGPAIGGLITDLFGWHWIFFVNVPVALVSFVVLYRLLPAIRHPDAGRNIDFVGAAVFSVAIGSLLVGLTNKATGQWTDPAVGGLIALGLLLAAVFVLIESRVPEPIVPLSLFRIRTFSISVAAVFLAAFGFFTAVVFLPRWFQTVAGASATESGYNLLPLIFGLIISATSSGQIVARVGRYKVLMFGGLLLVAFGLFLLTGLHTDTPRPVLWLWMLITGLGIGPTFAVFTLIVQNEVPPRQIGSATGALSFFQQIGGTVGLTIATTIFTERLIAELPKQLLAAGVPPALVAALPPGAGTQIIGTGDLGQRILESTPPAAQPVIAPLIPNLVAGIHEAFTVAMDSTFWVGIVASLLAAGLVLFLKERPMRQTHEVEEAAGASMTSQPEPG